MSVAAAVAPTVSVRAQADARIPALDGVRAMASLAVVFYHFGPHIAQDAHSPFHFLARLPRPGNEGVDLFFVLSGFLISGILVNARNSPRYFGTFYRRRAFRIFPLYYLLIVSYYAAGWILGAAKSGSTLFAHPLPEWGYWLYLQNFFMSAANDFGALWFAATWSLAVEEQFYLTLPAIVRRVTDRQLAMVAAMGVIGPLILRAAIQKFGHVSPVGAYVLLFTRMDALATGILVMLAMRYYSGWIGARSRRLGQLVASALIVWFVLPLLFPNSAAGRFAFTVFTQNAVVFGLLLLYVVAAPGGWVARFLSLSWMRTLGNMAYSTYMFHLIVLSLVFLRIRGGEPALNSSADLLPMGVALALTGLLSLASWQFFERRFIRSGHKYQY